MSASPPLLIRADASTAMGTGHVMRCIALAQAWQDMGGHATFAMTASTPALQTRLEAEGMNIIHLAAEWGSQDDAQQTATLAQEMGACCVVADGYHFGATYQQHIKAAGLKLLLVDDYGHAEHYSADIVLNQNMTADEAMYVCREPYTRLLLGTRYVLLRREFWRWRGWQRKVVPVARKVLVTLGGSDPDNVTLLVMQALHQIAAEDVEVVVLVGGGNPHYDTLHDTAQEAPYAVQLLQNVTDMPALMAWADLCIGAAGSTSWERCLLGLPSLLFVLADNQQPIAEHLHAQGIATNLGRTGAVSEAELARAIAQLAHDADTRAEMMGRGQALVDGWGAERAVMHMRCHSLTLRLVHPDDCRLLWEWANDPIVRAASFSSEPIPWDEHVSWFASKMQSQQCIHFIAINGNDIPVGQVRFDITLHEAEIDVSVAPTNRGYGYGSWLIQLATHKLATMRKVHTVHSHVKEDNLASIRAFQSAGFQMYESEKVHGYPAFHLIWRYKL